MPAATEKSCSFCEKKGLLLMPVRYAIAPLDRKLPGVVAPLKVEDVAASVGKGKPQDVKLQGSAQYTTRLLRSGYLYVYDEKRDQMDAWWGTEQGYFMRLPPGTVVSADARNAQPCNDTGHPELAGCIAIADAENTGTVWLGYSDVQWTQAVIDAHRGAAGKHLRALHMRAFDAGAWAKSHQQAPGQPGKPGRGSAAHAVPMSELASTVAEFAAKAPNVPNGFMPPSAPDYHLRAGKAEATQTACAKRSPRVQGAIVALDDPAGIAHDLAALIHWHQERLLNTRIAKDKYGKGYGSYDTTYRELTALDSAIDTLRAANDEKVKLQIFADAPALADYLKLSYEVAREDAAAMAATPTMANRPTTPGQFAKPLSAAEQARQKELDALVRNPSPEHVQASQKVSWSEYQARIKGSAQDAWRQEFAKASDAAQTQHIKPLAQAYTAWMQSNQLANKLESTHDGKDALSGDVYAQTLQRCMAGMQQIGACEEVYLRWLRGDITDKANVLLRALALRQDQLIDALAKSPLDPKAVPWGALMEQYQTHVQALLKPAADAKLQAHQAQQAANQAKQQSDAASKDYLQVLGVSPGLAWTNNPIKRKAEAAEAAAAAAQTQASAALQETKSKLLPDSVAAVLTQVAGPITTLLREFNGNAAEQTLMRWMAIVGVVIRTPVSVHNVTSTVRDTTEFLVKTFVENLAKAAEKNGKPMSGEQIRQLTQYAKKQVKGSFRTGNIGQFDVAQNNKTSAKLTVFVTDEMHKSIANIKDPTEKVKYLAAHAKSPQTLHEYGVMKIDTRKLLHGAVSEGVLTMIDGICKWAAWKSVLEAEAKALSFQKDWKQDTRDTIGGALFAGVLPAAIGNVAKGYGAWRNLYAMGLVERTAGNRVIKGAAATLKWTGTVMGALAGIAAAMDIFDAKQSYDENRFALMWLQGFSGAAGVAGAGVAIRAAWVGGEVAGWWGLSWTGWGVVFAIVATAIGMWINKVKGDDIAQWLERSFWGNHPGYDNADPQQRDFQKLMTQA